MPRTRETNAIWITWESQVRNYSMVRNINVRLFEFNFKGSVIKRYFYCLFKTASTLFKERPQVVFAPNPSLVLVLFLLHVRFLFRFKLVIDAHLIGVNAYDKGEFFQKILNYCNKRAHMVIVTNNDHKKFIDSLGGNAFVCEDPLPEIKTKEGEIKTSSEIVLFICSYESDEPYQAVFEAANDLEKEGLALYVSGNYKKAHINPSQYPHVNFLGYVPYSTYYRYLLSSVVVIDLTDSQNCLACGAYEAMMAEKPLVTSNTKVLKNYFTAGTVFTGHQPKDITDAIISAFKNRNQLSADIKKWKIITIENHEKKISRLRQYIVDQF